MGFGSAVGSFALGDPGVISSNWGRLRRQSSSDSARVEYPEKQLVLNSGAPGRKQTDQPIQWEVDWGWPDGPSSLCDFCDLWKSSIGNAGGYWILYRQTLISKFQFGPHHDGTWSRHHVITPLHLKSDILQITRLWWTLDDLYPSQPVEVSTVSFGSLICIRKQLLDAIFPDLISPHSIVVLELWHKSFSDEGLCSLSKSV
jgi:hypothetical protein